MQPTKSKRPRIKVLAEKVCSTLNGEVRKFPQRELQVQKVRLRGEAINYTTPSTIVDRVQYKRSMEQRLRDEFDEFRRKRMEEVRQFCTLFDKQLELSDNVQWGVY
jgi:hypothetical protein